MIRIGGFLRYRPGFKMPASHFCVALLLIALFAIPANACAQNDLPKEARDGIDKGLRAAQQQQWEMALQHFQAARKSAASARDFSVISAAPIFLNLGLAESKIPGRELRSIAWLRAYSFASPASPDSKQVTDLISDLDKTAQTNIEKMLRHTRQILAQIPGFDKNDYFLAEIAFAYALLGNSDAAKQIAEASDNAVGRDMAYHRIAVAQMEIGDLRGAWHNAGLIRFEQDGKTKLLRDIFFKEEKPKPWGDARFRELVIKEICGHLDDEFKGAPYIDLQAYLRKLSSENFYTIGEGLLEQAVQMATWLVYLRG